LKIPLISPDNLSSQQKQIYNLYCQGVSNKEISVKLNIDQRAVATQLSRIRKKAANLSLASLTYKIIPRAELVQNSTQYNSNASELKKKIHDDPGYFKLMFNRYAADKESHSENRYRLASAGKDAKLLFSARAKHIKVMVKSGKNLGHDKLVVKIRKEDRQVAREYLEKQKLKPLQIYWDDGSAVYLVTTREMEKIQQLLKSCLNKENN